MTLRAVTSSHDRSPRSYPGFPFRAKGERAPCDPAELLLDAIDRPNLDARVVEALPWIPFSFPGLNWDWLISEAHERDRQNRLGFLVALAARVAKRRLLSELAAKLLSILKKVDRIRLNVEDTLCQEWWPSSQRGLPARIAHRWRNIGISALGWTKTILIILEAAPPR
jgi:hypothetical protein